MAEVFVSPSDPPRTKTKRKPSNLRPGKDPGTPTFARISKPAAVFALALVVLVIYANSLGGQFVFDDTVIVQGNESIHGLDPAHLKEIFGQHYWKGVESSGGLYRPAVMLSYALDYAAGGEDPHGYHLVNVILHALNGILVFFILEERA